MDDQRTEEIAGIRRAKICSLIRFCRESGGSSRPCPAEQNEKINAIAREQQIEAAGRYLRVIEGTNAAYEQDIERIELTADKDYFRAMLMDSGMLTDPYHRQSQAIKQVIGDQRDQRMDVARATRDLVTKQAQIEQTLSIIESRMRQEGDLRIIQERECVKRMFDTSLNELNELLSELGDLPCHEDTFALWGYNQPMASGVYDSEAINALLSEYSRNPSKPEPAPTTSISGQASMNQMGSAFMMLDIASSIKQMKRRHDQVEEEEEEEEEAGWGRGFKRLRLPATTSKSRQEAAVVDPCILILRICLKDESFCDGEIELRSLIELGGPTLKFEICTLYDPDQSIYYLIQFRTALDRVRTANECYSHLVGQQLCGQILKMQLFLQDVTPFIHRPEAAFPVLQRLNDMSPFSQQADDMASNTGRRMIMIQGMDVNMRAVSLKREDSNMSYAPRPNSKSSPDTRADEDRRITRVPQRNNWASASERHKNRNSASTLLGGGDSNAAYLQRREERQREEKKPEGQLREDWNLPYRPLRERQSASSAPRPKTLSATQTPRIDEVNQAIATLDCLDSRPYELSQEAINAVAVLQGLGIAVRVINTSEPVAEQIPLPSTTATVATPTAPNANDLAAALPRSGRRYGICPFCRLTGLGYGGYKIHMRECRRAHATTAFWRCTTCVLGFESEAAFGGHGSSCRVWAGKRAATAAAKSTSIARRTSYPAATAEYTTMSGAPTYPDIK